jgi:prepilin-type N-terminal cleavage/methylation domain-containing protein
MQKKFISGFTLIEILLVIGIIAVLATVVIVALDPAQRFKDSRDARRRADVESISKAIQQYAIDSQGTFPTGLDEEEKQLGTAIGECAVAGNGGCFADSGNCLDLSSDLARYLKLMPTDPTYGEGGTTFYTVVRDTNNIVTVRACGAEGEEEISVSQ